MCQAIELNVLVMNTPHFLRKWALRPFYYFFSKKLAGLTSRYFVLLSVSSMSLLPILITGVTLELQICGGEQLDLKQ